MKKKTRKSSVKKSATLTKKKKGSMIDMDIWLEALNGNHKVEHSDDFRSSSEYAELWGCGEARARKRLIVFKKADRLKMSFRPSVSLSGKRTQTPIYKIV